MIDSVTPTQVESAQDIGLTPSKIVTRWLLELQLADKREKEWRKRAAEIEDKYRQKDDRKNTFNLLWTNTDTLLPAVYNSQPKPDVRRRFRDADPVGKAVAEVLGRALEYSIDTYDFNAVMSHDVLDMLLPGRGVSRVRYVPSMTPGAGAEAAEQPGEEATEGDAEELAWEQVVAEHVQWDDYREGPGKVWDEVPWVAYRHRMTRDELVRKFPACGEEVALDASADEEVEKHGDDQIKELFKTAVVWEIWDKDKREVLFISPGYKEKPLQQLPDPLRLERFYPGPRPLRAVLDSSSGVPIPIPDYYKEQESELNSITQRISKLIKALKLRGVYDATLGELSELMRGDDNDLVPAQNVEELRERGGLDAAIWFMPIETAAAVLRELYAQREQTKQIIYEITGISDIMRGATEAEETATAQRIKANFGSVRVRRMQAEVARYVRDILRIKAEIIAERFQTETLASMTGLQYPTGEQKQQAVAAAQQAQAAGQQPPPQLAELLQKPSWDDIMACLRNDAMRTFKVDIETDSTVAASLEDDMQGMQQVLQGVVEVINGLGPAVQQGALPVEVLKELVLAVVRRARMGNAIEDAIDKVQQPSPQQGKQDHSVEVAQIKAKSDQDRAAMELQMEQQRLASSERLAEKQAQLDVWVATQQQAAQQKQADDEARMNAHYKTIEAAQQAQADRFHAMLEEQSKQADRNMQLILQRMKGEQAVEVAEIGAETTLQAAQVSAARQSQGDD